MLFGLVRAVEVGFNHVGFQGGGCGSELRWEEATGDVVTHGHGRVPNQEA